jgi:hypothetical protein
MTWEGVKERILKEDKDGILTWEEVKKQVKKEKEDEEKKWEEIRKYDAEESERLAKKSTFVTSHSIKFTREEYDKLKTAFCKGKWWSLDYPHTVKVHSITLSGNYKWMPQSNVEFCIEIEG